MRRILFVLLVVLMAVGVIDTAAQEENNCTMEQYKEASTQLFAQIQASIDAATTPDEMLELFLGIETLLDTIRYQCAGLELSSENYQNGIVGPVIFGGTLYQATFTSSSFGSVQFTVLEGDCGFIPPTIIVTDMNGGEETDLLEFGGDCVAMIEVNADEWTLNFERLK